MYVVYILIKTQTKVRKVKTCINVNSPHLVYSMSIQSFGSQGQSDIHINRQNKTRSSSIGDAKSEVHILYANLIHVFYF